MLPKKGKHIVYFIHSQSLLTLFQVSHKPKTHSCPLSQFNLRETVYLSFLLNMF